MRAVVAAASLVALAGCRETETYTSTVEVLQVERFGKPVEAASALDLELRYADCPGDARRVLRADAALTRCLGGVVPGDRLKAEITSRYRSDRGVYRSEIVKLGDCAVRLDPKEEANYEMVQSCAPLETTGALVGVHCERKRTAAVVEACPFLRRK